MFGFDGPFDDDSPLEISPTSITLMVGTGTTFSGAGGTGPYTFSFVANNSGGTINPTTGVYVAGSTPNVTDTVRITDAALDTADATVAVKPQINITPSNATVQPGGTQLFVSSGGVTTPTPQQIVINNTGCTLVLQSPGVWLYTAGPITGVDTIRATDAQNNEDLAVITVTLAPVVISPSSATVRFGSTKQFTASGGSETGFTWTLLVDNSGGSIDSVTGLYTAGETFGVTDTIQVEDSLGNTATADIDVTEMFAIWDVIQSPDTQGNLRFIMTEGVYNLLLVHEGDLAYIYGDEFEPTNTNGTYTIQRVYVIDGEAWFEIENPLGEEMENIEQERFQSLMFFRAKRKTIYDNARHVIVCEKND